MERKAANGQKEMHATRAARQQRSGRPKWEKEERKEASPIDYRRHKSGAKVPSRKLHNFFV